MTASRCSSSVFLAAALPCLLAGCLLDAGPFEGAGAGPETTSSTSAQGGDGTGTGGSGASAGGATASGGTTASGGATAGSGGTTTTSTTSTTTTETGTTCSIDAQCPNPSSLCLTGKCDKGVCTAVPANEDGICGAAMGECYDVAKCKAGACVSAVLPNGTVLPDAPNNCKKRVCAGNGTAMSKNDDADHAASDECVQRSCAGGNPVEQDINIGGDCLFHTGYCCAGVCCIGAFGCCANSGTCDYGICQ